MRRRKHLLFQQVADDVSAVLAVGAVADVHPVGALGVVLPYQLVEVAVLHDPRHPLAALLLVTIYAEVNGLALCVLRVCHTAYGWFSLIHR